MTEQNNSSQEDPKDGFDLLEYPCQFQFKAMVRVGELARNTNAVSAVSTVLLEVLPAAEIVDSSSNLSRTGKFESVSLTVELASREQLEAVYAALAADPKVVMTL